MNGRVLLSGAGVFARMVKIEHTVFALPFAYMGAFLAAGGLPGWRAAFFLTVAMFAVRSFAMSVNRLLDLRFDRANPRTASRPLVTGELSVRACILLTLGCAVLFIAACAGLNPLCLALSLPALAWSALYSLTKRFTWLCHFMLGTVLGLAPIAGWISVRPEFSTASFLLATGVTFWVAGFDILYSAQDMEFDREHALHSAPVRFGLGPALLLSTFSHVNAALFFLYGGLAAGLGWIYVAVWGAAAAVLLWEHTLVSEHDLSRVNTAFFTMNGFVALSLFAGAAADLFLS